MNPGEQRLCDGHEIGGLISSMARKLADARRVGVPLYLVGVRTRGVPLAQRLAQELCRLLGQDVTVGAVDITLYRDDIGRTQRWPVLRGTDIPFDLDGAEVVLVDDVLFTGRTVRAALNAICDLGRPACVRLAVLVDRGHREIPIQPDVVGLHMVTNFDDHVGVRLQPVDPVEEVVKMAAGSRKSPLPRSAEP
ncbi:MAG TPA: bifunctional pyr operon transcriptional regulator/uracil phosphoribosyltransferase PyrR [Isosphaeraceae bacterium]|nr:bifunctional pyr operon transcriptional regulator/uracil phosphoribosyltransferase PyrR [Isosphaeraceae bacterium]